MCVSGHELQVPERLEAEAGATDQKGTGVTGSWKWVLGTELDSTARVILA